MKTARIALAAAAMLAMAGAAQAITIATFQDPATDGTTPLFNANLGAGTVSGGWSAAGLNLSTFAGLFPNATFSMAPINIVSNPIPGIFFTGAGAINFFDSSSNPLFTINFQNALLSSSLGLAASDFSGLNVTFSGPLISSNFVSISQEQFSFSFANPVATAGGFTVTSSFTSSADAIVPAPGAAALLGLGGLVAIRRRR